MSDLYYDEILKVDKDFIMDLLNNFYIRELWYVYNVKRGSVKKFIKQTN